MKEAPRSPWAYKPLAEWIEASGKSVAHYAKEIGLSAGGVNKIVKGKYVGDLKKDTAAKLYAFCKKNGIKL